MKHTGRLYAIPLTLLVVGIAALVGGCGQKPFSIPERKICAQIDGSGNPVDARETFSTTDSTVYVWFRYSGAKPSQVVKVRVQYKDPTGVEATEETQTELKAGSGSASAQLNPPEGEGLAPGTYIVEVMNESDIAYGGPVTFRVE